MDISPKIAHSIKTAAKNIKAFDVAEMALQLEQAVNQGRMDDIQHDFETFTKIVRQMLNALERELEHHFGSD